MRKTIKQISTIVLSVIILVSSISIPTYATELDEIDESITIEETLENNDLELIEENINNDSLAEEVLFDSEDLISINSSELVENTEVETPDATESGLSEEKDTILEAKTNEIISHMNPAWGEEEKALYLHDWLVLNCTYDERIDLGHEDGFNAYGAIVDKLAVCQGYANAYYYLLNKVGIEAYIVVDSIHAWNLIKINNKYYYVDITNDDYGSTTEQGNDALDISNYNNAQGLYKAFMKSENIAAEYMAISNNWRTQGTGPMTGLRKNEIVTPTDHDNYYLSGQQGTAYYDLDVTTELHGRKKAYTIINNDNIYVHDYATNTDEIIYTITNGENRMFLTWLGNYLAVASGNTIYLIDTDSKSLVTSRTIDNIAYPKLICNLSASNGILTYSIGEIHNVHYKEIRVDSTNTVDFSSYYNIDVATPLTVSFNTNGGSTIPSQNVTYGTKLTLPAEPTKDNLVFGEWYVDPELTKPFNENYLITENLTLYAKWYGSHTVTFDTDGGSYIAPVQVMHKSTVAKPADPTKSGYYLTSWADKEKIKKDGSYMPYDFSQPVLKDLTLKAIYMEGYSGPVDPGPITPPPVDPGPITPPAPVNPTPEQPKPTNASNTFMCSQNINIKDLYFSELTNIAKYKVTVKNTGLVNTKYASVSNKGILSCKKPETVIITPQYKEGKYYHDFENQQVTIKILPKPALKFTKIPTYEGQTINAYDFFKDDWSKLGYKAVKFTSSNTNVATVNDNGIITTGFKTGSTTITAWFNVKGENYATNNVKVTGKLTVKHPAFSKTTYNLKTGQKLTLSMKNVNAVTDPSFSSDNENGFTVTKQLNSKQVPTGKAILVAKNCGDYTLTATIDGQDYACTIHVIDPVIKKTELKVKVNKKVTVGLKNTNYKANQIEWHSENNSIATVDVGGKVTGIKEGTVKIYTETGGIRNECIVTVY